MQSNPNVPCPLLFTMTAAHSGAHGEAGANGVGAYNLTLFARELTLLKREQLGFTERDGREALASLMSAFPVGNTACEYLGILSGAQLVATIFAAQFPLIYGSRNKGDGEGLFAGIGRYEYLQTRLSDAAASCSTLATAWGQTARRLNLPVYPEDSYRVMAALFSLPKPIQAGALSAFLEAPELVIMSARFVADSIKAASPEYARKASQPASTLTVYQPTLEQAAEVAASEGKLLPVRIPNLSGNSLRHSLLREPMATRLLSAVGVTPDNPVPVGVSRFLYSGGNTTKGARAPGAADMHEAKVRKLLPMVEALGGSFDQFLLSRSAVSIASWIVCRENNWITERRTDGAVRSDASIFDLVTETTRTRGGIGGNDKESGQMIFSYETLAAQTQVLTEIRWQPFTSRLAIGATLQGLLDWQAGGGTIGARGAQGHSQMVATFEPDARFDWADEYLDYLTANKDAIAAHLKAATFGTEVALCAAV